MSAFQVCFNLKDQYQSSLPLLETLLQPGQVSEDTDLGKQIPPDEISIDYYKAFVTKPNSHIFENRF